MKKVYTALTLLFALSLSALAQSGAAWVPVGQGVQLYPQTSIVVDGKLYVMSNGYKTDNSNSFVNQIHRLDDGEWTLLSEIRGSTSLFGSYNGNLYMAIAIADTIGRLGPNEITRWDGSTWQSIARVNGGINAMIEYQGELYIGGSFDSIAGAPMNKLARWNGTRWAAIGMGAITRGPALNTAVYRFKIYNDELFAGGSFSSIDSVQSVNIARWNGRLWSGVEGGFDREPGIMEVYNDELYVFGPRITRAGNVTMQGLARWNGKHWDSVGAHGKWVNIRDMTVNNGRLYAVGAGELWPGGMVTAAVVWDGRSWEELPLLDSSATINFVESYEGDIYIGGRFIRFGATPLNHVARLSTGASSVQQPLSADAGLVVYPNPTSGVVHLQGEIFSGSMIEVKDLFGRTLLRTASTGRDAQTIDLSTLAAGAYILSIPTEKGTMLRKVSIVR